MLAQIQESIESAAVAVSLHPLELAGIVAGAVVVYALARRVAAWEQANRAQRRWSLEHPMEHPPKAHRRFDPPRS